MTSHRISRRALLGAPLALAAGPALAQGESWPARGVRMIVPYPAGGSTDVLFRILAERLKDRFGQPFVVGNRPGASGNLGIDQVVKSPPDGYTVGCATVGHFAINQYLIANMPFDAERDLVAPALTYELLSNLPSEASSMGRLLRTILPGAFQAYRQRLGLESMYAAEAVAVMAAIRPELIVTEAMPCDVETEGLLTYGATVIDRRPRTFDRPNMDVAVDVDAAEVVSGIVRGLRDSF